MKQKDIALIVMVAFVSAVLAFVLTSVLITSPKNRHQKVEVVEKISPDFPQPDPGYFNINSVDPTQLITIGDNTNSTPFNSKISH